MAVAEANNNHNNNHNHNNNNNNNNNNNSNSGSMAAAAPVQRRPEPCFRPPSLLLRSSLRSWRKALSGLLTCGSCARRWCLLGPTAAGAHVCCLIVRGRQRSGARSLLPALFSLLAFPRGCLRRRFDKPSPVLRAFQAGFATALCASSQSSQAALHKIKLKIKIKGKDKGKDKGKGRTHVAQQGHAALCLSCGKPKT